MSETKIVEIDEDLRDLIPAYMEHRRQDIEKMRAQLKAGDFDSIRLTGHSMKGSGAGYGFSEITEIGKRIEKAAADRNSSIITRQINKLEKYITSIEIVFVP